MKYFVQFQINVFAIVILVVLYMIIRTKSKVDSFGKRLLKAVMLFTTVAIIMEPLTWIFDGATFTGAYFLEYGSNFILFLVGPVLCGLMLSYVDYHIFKEPSRLYKRKFYMSMSVLTLGILILNFFEPIYFSINSVTNHFSSGDYKLLHYAIISSFYFYMIYFVLKNKQKTYAYVVNIFLIFFGLPILGMFVQLLDSKLYFSWTSIVLAILVVYIFLETSSNEQDYLTKLYNRQSYEIYLHHLIELNKSFGIVLIDLNYFKEINDIHGHHRGDQVLVGFARILEKVFQESTLVSRLGGDEFLVVIENSTKNVDSYADEIQKLLLKSDDLLLQKLSFSYGYQVYKNDMSIDELYNSADKKMYQYKTVFKSERI